MKYKLYFIIHFSIILIISLKSVIHSYITYHDIENEKIENVNDFIDNLLDNSVYNSYAIFTGTNTGYGFYGLNVATYKFFVVELYDFEDNLINKVSTFGFKNKTNLQRFDVLSSKIANSISENKKKFEENTQENENIVKFRKDFIRKIFKYVGLSQAKKYNNCKYFIVKLYTLAPDNIWENNLYHQSKNAANYETFKFEL